MVRASALIALALLGGCQNRNPDICSDTSPRLPFQNPSGAREVQANAQACVEHWAARLSLGPDSAQNVADAAIGACQTGIAEAGLYMSGKPAVDAWKSDLRSLAIFRAVQQRAGHCGIPPLE